MPIDMERGSERYAWNTVLTRRCFYVVVFLSGITAVSVIDDPVAFLVAWIGFVAVSYVISSAPVALTSLIYYRFRGRRMPWFFPAVSILNVVFVILAVIGRMSAA
jgi:hypothetical protein